MPSPTRRREQGRGERVLPGLWRLRLPLPWPGIPHGNAYALAAGDEIVLVDCGMHEPGSMEELERALEQVGLRLESVRLLVCTHAHPDHCGQAAPIVERSGCELWMHPDRAHLAAQLADPDAALARTLEIGRQSGVPDAPLRRWAEGRRGEDPGVAAPLAPDRDLVEGVTFTTDHGEWSVHPTPGHAPSHVCLFEAESRVLLSGDHLLGRVSLYFDFGWSPDPVGEFLASLDHVEALDARLCLSGHGRPFTDVAAHITSNRSLVAERLAAVRAALGDYPRTAYELAPAVFGPLFVSELAPWLLTKTLCYLRHLEVRGEIAATPGAPERWRLAN